MNLIDQHRDEIKAACDAFNIKELHVFGSVLSEQFSTESDVDFAVEFHRDSFEGSFDQFISFKTRLEEILNRDVDLVSPQSVRNPVFLRTLHETKQLIYAA